jgi:WhiB family redox-sensing transcriptional regulator
MSKGPTQTFLQVIVDWQDASLCTQTDPDLFFAADNERGRAKNERIAQAKAICNQCPVILNCLQRAVYTNDAYAIMGGTTPEERGHLNDGSGKMTTSWSLETILANKAKEAVNA